MTTWLEAAWSHGVRELGSAAVARVAKRLGPGGWSDVLDWPLRRRRARLMREEVRAMPAKDPDSTRNAFLAKVTGVGLAFIFGGAMILGSLQAFSEGPVGVVLGILGVALGGVLLYAGWQGMGFDFDDGSK